VVRLCGLTKGEIEARLTKFNLQGLSFIIAEENLDCRIELIYSGMDENAFAIEKSQIYNEFSDNVYSSKDLPLNSFAVELLMHSHYNLSVAESLTGGEVSCALIDVPGISSHFYEGIVCYNTEAKARRLGVSKKTLSEDGAVSKKTAYEMVKGLLATPETSLGLSTTGVAGPSSEEGKQVGLVYIAVGSGDFITVFEHNFCGERNEIRKKATNMALFYLVRFLMGNILLL